MKPQNPSARFIDWRYRLALMARFALFICCGLAVFGLGLLMALNQRLGIGYAKDLAALSALQERLPVILIAGGVITMAVISIAGFFLALFWTHAVSGPLVRVQRCLAQLADSQDSAAMRFRSTDQLHSVAKSLEKLIAARRSQRAAWEVFLVKADQAIKGCEAWRAQHPGDAIGMRQRLQLLKKEYQAMHRLLKQGDSGLKP